MNIRVARLTAFTVYRRRRDPKNTKPPPTPSRGPLDKCGVTLGEDDRPERGGRGEAHRGHGDRHPAGDQGKGSPRRRASPTTPEYQDTDELYYDESEVKTAGEAGEKEVTYQVTYVDGVEESREALSEKVTKEPVSEVILQGTKEYPVEEEEETPSAPSGQRHGERRRDLYRYVRQPRWHTALCSAAPAPPTPCPGAPPLWAGRRNTASSP